MIRKLHINEEYVDSPNQVVNKAIDEFVKFLKDKDIIVDDVSYSNKAIYINDINKAERATDYLKFDCYPTRQLGVMIYCPRLTGNIEKVIPDRTFMDEGIEKKGHNNMRLRIKELNEAVSTSVPKLKTFNTDAVSMSEIIVRDILKMKKVYDDAKDVIYVGKMTAKDLVVAYPTAAGKEDACIFLVFNDLTKDDKDDIITKCSEGTEKEDVFFEDYNTKEYSFWEFVTEHLY